MSEPINNQHNVDERANQQCQIIEQTLNMLLKDISVKDLTTSQRLNFAIKVLSPYVRMLALQHTIQCVQSPVSEAEAFYAELRQSLRLSSEEKDVDAPSSHNHESGLYLIKHEE